MNEIVAEDLCIDVREFPGCCTMQVISDFPSDNKIKNSSEPERDWLAAIRDETRVYMDQNEGVGFITLSDKQKKSQEVIEKLGCKVVGTYEGHEGRITVFQYGLRAPRKKGR